MIAQGQAELLRKNADTLLELRKGTPSEASAKEFYDVVMEELGRAKQQG